MELWETLDTGTNFRQWLYGNGLEAKYSFAMAKTTRGLQEAPPDFPLGEKTKDEKKKEITEEFGTPNPVGLQFIVEFSSIDPGEPVWVNNFRVNTERVVEMHFGRTECKLEYQPMGRRFYWRPTSDQSDRDEGDLSAKDALKVFSGVSQVALKYCRDRRPDGVVLSTREDSKDSRGRIYRKIAERLATESGAMVAGIAPLRPDMKSPTLVWFPGILR